MRTTFFSGMLLAALACAPLSAQDDVFFEDFEDNILTYTTNLDDALDNAGTNDYYGRVGLGDIGTDMSYGNLFGSTFYGVHDSDEAAGGGGPTPDDLVELNWSVDASDYTGLSLSWWIAEDDSTLEGWDSTSSFQVAVQLDNGGFATIFAVESQVDPSVSGNFTDELPRVDTDLNGIGDGTEITDTFTQFSSPIADAGTIDVRIRFIDLNDDDEDLALDNVRLEGTFIAIPEPASASLLMAAMIGTFVRRRRS